MTRTSAHHLHESQRAGLKVLVALTGNRARFTDASGCFDLSLWKQDLDRHEAEVIREYVESGTIVGLYALDEPHDWDCGPTYRDIDDACRYALDKWPGIRCGVNAPPGWLERGKQQLAHLGFILVQYSRRQGGIDAWLERQDAGSQWFAGDIWYSIQILEPWISAAEALEIGIKMCAAGPRGVMLWKWSSQWFQQARARDSIRELVSACRQNSNP